MRPRRLELPCLSALAPQAGVSTSSTKAANHLDFNIIEINFRSVNIPKQGKSIYFFVKERRERDDK